MQFNFTEIFQHMGAPAMAVAAILLVMGNDRHRPRRRL
jgi:hypothetical protein